MAEPVRDTYSTDGPICPHCEHQHEAGDEPSFYYNERLDEMDCERCGKLFKVEVYTRTSWSCEPATPSPSGSRV